MESPSCQLRLTRRFQASAEELWHALTDPKRVGRWLGRPLRFDVLGSGDIELGLPDGTTVTGSVRKLDPPHLLELDWVDGHGESSLVRIKVVPEGKVTVMVLDHIRIQERLGMRYLGSWELTLDRFTAAVQ